MVFRHPRAVDDAALVSVYVRPDALYLITSVRTTAGLWLYPAKPATLIQVIAPPHALGEKVLELLRAPAAIVQHPNQAEWTDQGRASLEPLQAQAKVRSWRAFLAESELIEIERNGLTVTITRMERDSRRPDVFMPTPGLTRDLPGLTATELGDAILSVR